MEKETSKTAAMKEVMTLGKAYVCVRGKGGKERS